MVLMEIGVKSIKLIECAAGQQEIKKNIDHIAAAIQESRNRLSLIMDSMPGRKIDTELEKVYTYLKITGRKLDTMSDGLEAVARLYDYVEKDIAGGKPEKETSVIRL